MGQEWGRAAATSVTYAIWGWVGAKPRLALDEGTIGKGNRLAVAVVLGDPVSAHVVELGVELAQIGIDHRGAGQIGVAAAKALPVLLDV